MYVNLNLPFVFLTHEDRILARPRTRRIFHHSRPWRDRRVRASRGCPLTIAGLNWTSSALRFEPAPDNGWCSRLLANSLCPGQEKRRMREPEVQIANPG